MWRRAALSAALWPATRALDASAPPQLCQGQLAIGGADPSFVKGSGGFADGGALSLEHDAGLSIVGACDEISWDPQGFTLFKLLGKTLSFTVDLSKVGCGCNLALYLISEPALDRAGSPEAAGEGAPDFCESSPYYCDANKVCGTYCPEIDIMEANSHVFASTPHSCDAPDSAGHYESCDVAGCGANTRDMPGDVYGPGDSFLINTRLPFSVRTTFVGSVAPPTLDGFEAKLVQGDNVVDLDHTGCAATLGLLRDAVEQGMAMRITYWGDDAETMSWLDAPPCLEETCTGGNTGTAVISGLQVQDAGAEPAATPAPTTATPAPPILVSTQPPTAPPSAPPTPSPTAAPTAAPTAPPTTAPTTTPAAPTTTTSALYDCDEAYDDWQTVWSYDKMHWCCDQAARGCQLVLDLVAEQVYERVDEPREERAYELVAGQACPSGYAAVTSEEECSRARESVGTTGWHGQELSASPHRLPYCWVGSYGYANFNPAGDTGDSAGDARGVVCRVTSGSVASESKASEPCSASDGSAASDVYPCFCGDVTCFDGQLCVLPDGRCDDQSLFDALMHQLSEHWWLMLLPLCPALCLLPLACPGAFSRGGDAGQAAATLPEAPPEKPQGRWSRRESQDTDHSSAHGSAGSPPWAPRSKTPPGTPTRGGAASPWGDPKKAGGAPSTPPGYAGVPPARGPAEREGSPGGLAGLLCGMCTRSSGEGGGRTMRAAAPGSPWYPGEFPEQPGFRSPLVQGPGGFAGPPPGYAEPRFGALGAPPFGVQAIQGPPLRQIFRPLPGGAYQPTHQPTYHQAGPYVW